MPLAGKRIADVGTGIGHYPLLLARRTGRTYGIEADPALVDEARRRAAELHQPNLRIVEGIARARIPLRDGAVDVVLTGLIDADDASLPLIAEAMRVLRPGGRLVVIGYYGRDDVAAPARAGGRAARAGGDAAPHGLVAAQRLQDQGRPHAPRPARRGDRPRAAPAPVRRPRTDLPDGPASAHAGDEARPLPPRQGP